MKIAIITTDNREHDRAYDETLPRFGAGCTSLFQGFTFFPSDIEVHARSVRFNFEHL